jgi:hypothetical protein
MGVILSLIKWMHSQVIQKLEEVVRSNGEIKQSIAVHNEKLEASATQFAEIREHQKMQDERLNSLEIKVVELQINR